MDPLKPASNLYQNPFAVAHKGTAKDFRSKLIYQRKSSSKTGSNPEQMKAMAKSSTKLKPYIEMFRSLRKSNNLALNACIENCVRHSLDQLAESPRDLHNIQREVVDRLNEMNALATCSYPLPLDHTDIVHFGLSEFLDVMDQGAVTDRNKLKLTLLADMTPGQQESCVNGMVDFVRIYWTASQKTRNKLLQQPEDFARKFCQAWVEFKDKHALRALPGCNQAIDEIAESIVALRLLHIDDSEATLSSSASDAGSRRQVPATRRPRNPRQTAQEAYPPPDSVEQTTRTRIPKNPRAGKDQAD